MFKRGLFVAVVLIVLVVVSAGDAELILTVNGVDLANSALEVEGVERLVVGIGGDTEIEPNACSVVATSGVLEPVSGGQEYLFEFEEPAVSSVVRLIAERDMVIDGVEVCAEETIYYLVLFREGERVVAFGANLEVLFAPEAEAEPPLETEPVDESGLEALAEAERLVFKPVEQEDKKVLVHCPWSAGGMGAPAVGWGEFGGTGGGGEVMESMDFSSASAGESGSGGMMMGMDGVIDVNSDITSNTMWTAENTYHVLNAIDVNGALLVIEPGTVVVFAAGVNAGIRIVNGGALISVGRPNEPVIYTSDAVSPWYDDYYCPIYIEESASVSTKVAYSYIEYAYAGVVVMNKRLDVSIENNWLFHNVYGIVEYGAEHTDVSNNLIFRSYTSGIEVSLESFGGQADANSHILIENNTCDYYQDYGITVHGVDDGNDAGTVVLANNIVSESYLYGLNLVDGYMYASVLNMGYYGNTENKNWGFEEDNPAIETVNPYRDGSGYIPICYLAQDCNFIDAGYQHVGETSLIGKTTDVNSEPDSNYVDIGFHYPNWDFSNAGDGNTLESDFNLDLIVNFADFVVLADGWQSGYDMNDLAELAGEWLDIVSAHPNISVTVSGDPCNLSGDVTVGVDGIAYATEEGFIYVDGQITETIDYTAEEEYTILDSFVFRNGTHEIKAVTVDANGLITLSENTTVNFNNVIHCVAASESFDEGQNYRISALTASSNDFRVKVVDWTEGATVWTSPASSGQLKIAIPGGVLDGPIFDLQIEENTIVESESWEERWKRGIGKEYIPGTLYKFGVFLPRGRNHFGRSSSECRKKAVAEIVRICEAKSWPYAVLYRGECNWGNFSDVLSQTSIKYVYLVCHGGTHVREGRNTVQRTNFKISSRGWFGCDRVVSYKGGLPGKMETSNRVHSMASLGLGTRTQIRLAQVDGCVQTEYQDMARGWINFDEQPILEQLYSGYKSSCKDFHPDWQKWSYDLWNELSESSTTYWDAFQEIQKPQNNESGFEISQAVQWYGHDQITLE